MYAAGFTSSGVPGPMRNPRNITRTIGLFEGRKSNACVRSLSVQKSDRDRGNNAQRDEDEERYAHANRQTVGKRGLTGRDSHKPCEPFVEFHDVI